MTADIGTLSARVNDNPRLVHRGRFVDTHFLVAVGDDEWLIHVRDGKIGPVLKGPFVMPRWTFALRARWEDWDIFWSATPPPGWHDLFALIRFGRLRVEGDQHPFMANLFYFKGVMESIRVSS